MALIAKDDFREAAIQAQEQSEFDTYLTSDASKIPRIVQSQLDDVSMWRIKEIYTIQQACLLMAGISPFKVKSISEARDKGYSDYQLELASVVLDAMIDGLLLGTLTAHSIFCYEFNGSHTVSQDGFSDYHRQELDVDATRILAGVFFKWIKSRGIESALQASKKNQLDETRVLSIGASYTTPAIALIIDHIEQNLDGAPPEYLNDFNTQKQWLRSTGKQRGLSQNVCDAAHAVTRAPDVVKKFTKGHPAQGKSQEK